MQLSTKQKTFSVFFCLISEIYINISTFRKNDDPQGLCFSETTDSEGCGEINI